MTINEAKGVYAIAVTPFHDDGRINLDGIGRLCDFYAEAGACGLTILGMMGEAQKLDAAEATEVIRRFMAHSSVPVVVGVSSPGFAPMQRLAQEAMALGAAGVMVAPSANLRTDDQIVGYYANVLDAIGSDIPLVIQDFPLAQSVVMSPAVIRRIVNDNPACAMLKHEDWPGLDKITQLRAWQADGSLRPISILCGNGGAFLDLEMARGADGAMTGYAFPEMLVDVVDRARQGDIEAAMDIFDVHLPLVRYEQQPGLGLAARKYVLHRRGVLSSEAQRRPGPELSPAGKGEVELLLKRMSRHDPRANIG
ncbi:dihydrodipicolinate synthase family protein [Rhizobium lusitanum]|uniref:Dihydrodipicolinate synthase family protein n=1 Tax=Rhizobium lusitanum TaxID=293958 RepID=A0A6L9UGZ1_9HYPH|nr:dihydrodipicolinate synthase family protein [Rhizobium lusitanum]NEI73622.1 dihydrodipicolinate synthase family protein [Rhizobium lusitanum]